jgi:hypothetical protein
MKAEFSICYSSGKDNQLDAAVFELLKSLQVSHIGFVYNEDSKRFELRGKISALTYERLEIEINGLRKTMNRDSLEIKPIFDIT